MNEEKIIDFRGKVRHHPRLHFPQLFSPLLFAHSPPPHTTFFLFIFILFFAIAINNQFHKSDSLTHSSLLLKRWWKFSWQLEPYEICEMLERFFVLRWKKSMQRLGKKERNRSFLRYISHKVITFKCYCCCYFHFLLFSRSLALFLSFPPPHTRRLWCVFITVASI